MFNTRKKNKSFTHFFPNKLLQVLSIADIPDTEIDSVRGSYYFCICPEVKSKEQITKCK